ncbi:MAG TPA: cyclic peptide export ABC transporter [Pyrinomonadaceae bacterium]|nr:cyclic peptide export ABC transporter [Pyrinomonadaceae bacterium]
MKILIFMMKYSRGIVILSIVAGLISGLSNTGLVALVHNILGRGQNRPEFLLFAYIGLCLLLPLARFTSQILLTQLSQKGVFELRLQMSRQILSAPLRRLEEIGSARIMSSLTDDLFIITNTLTSVPVLCMQLAVVIGSLAYMAWLSWKAFLLVLVSMALGILSFRTAVNKAMRYMVLARQDSDVMFRHYRALNDGAKEFKLHRTRRNTFINEVMRTTALSMRRNNVTGTGIMAFASSWYQIIFFTLIGLLLFVVPQIQTVDSNLLTGYVLAIFYMLIPFEDLTGLIPRMARANISLQRIEELGLSLTTDVKESEDENRKADQYWERLELKGVTHSYYNERDGSTFTLGPVDFTFKPGELVFLVGGNGSGKTTLAKLLSGLYMPETGEISLDGTPITDQNRDDYRQFFSAVFYDFFLFESLLGLDPEKLDDRARDYLAQLQLDHKVQIKEGELSTIDLSQGQRKRLALLTAFLEDRPFYIFDEWAADQDPVFREIFYLQILSELKAKNKTVLVISHDDRYYHLGDHVIKLDYGKIVTPQQLPQFAERAFAGVTGRIN